MVREKIVVLLVMIMITEKNLVILRNHLLVNVRMDFLILKKKPKNVKNVITVVRLVKTQKLTDVLTVNPIEKSKQTELVHPRKDSMNVKIKKENQRVNHVHVIENVKLVKTVVKINVSNVTKIKTTLEKIQKLKLPPVPINQEHGSQSHLLIQLNQFLHVSLVKDVVPNVKEVPLIVPLVKLR